MKGAKVIRRIIVAAFAGLLIAGCGIAHGSSGSSGSSGRVPGDNGKLLPKLSCWLDVTFSGNDAASVALAVPHGATVNCHHYAKLLHDKLGGGAQWTVMVSKPVPLSQLPDTGNCTGFLGGLRATSIPVQGVEAFIGDDIAQALAC